MNHARRPQDALRQRRDGMNEPRPSDGRGEILRGFGSSIYFSDFSSHICKWLKPHFLVNSLLNTSQRGLSRRRISSSCSFPCSRACQYFQPNFSTPSSSGRNAGYRPNQATGTNKRPPAFLPDQWCSLKTATKSFRYSLAPPVIAAQRQCRVAPKLPDHNCFRWYVIPLCPFDYGPDTSAQIG